MLLCLACYRILRAFGGDARGVAVMPTTASGELVFENAFIRRERVALSRNCLLWQGEHLEPHLRALVYPRGHTCESRAAR